MKKMKRSTFQKPNGLKAFEKAVLQYFNIPHELFDNYVEKYRGYALLLRIWIEEKQHHGNSAIEVATMIKKSKLRLRAIKNGDALYIVFPCQSKQ